MTTNLTGKLLVAMPSLSEETFARSVVLLCAHSPQGAMGLIVNKLLPDVSFLDLAATVDLSEVPDERAERLHQTPVMMGGPVDVHRGFVLHTDDYPVDDSGLRIGSMALSATVDILRDMAAGKGPNGTLLALGYSGWAPGQLERELAANGWLHCDAAPEIIFHAPHADRYSMAMARIGIDPAMLSAEAGHA